MQLYLFWSEGDLEIFALTDDAAGNNLPSEFAPWSQNGDGAALYVGQDSMETSNLVVRLVQRDGFYLARTGAPRAKGVSWNVH